MTAEGTLSVVIYRGSLRVAGVYRCSLGANKGVIGLIVAPAGRSRRLELDTLERRHRVVAEILELGLLKR